MHRAVLDTNVIVSGSATTSTVPHKILESWRKSDFVLVTSPPILKEVREVLLRQEILKFAKASPAIMNKPVSEISERSFITAGTLEIDVVEKDPDDNKFIACAIEGQATHIVTGDKHLLSIKSYEDIKIVTPRNFLEELKKKN